MKDSYRSIAVWPDGFYVGSSIQGKNETSDTHASKEAAEAVCRVLEKRGFGGGEKVYPVSTRVELIEDQP